MAVSNSVKAALRILKSDMKEAQNYTVTMTERDKRALDFLLSADFSPINGYSYGELLDYLRQFKYYYGLIYDDRREMKRTIELSVLEIERLSKKIETLEKTIEKRDYQNRNLKEELGRKLTWKERLTGKIILKL